MLKFVWPLAVSFCTLLGALLASIASAQDFTSIAAGVFAFSSPYLISYPNSTNGFTATIAVESTTDTKRVLPLTLRRLDKRLSGEVKFTDFVPSESAKRAFASLGIDDLTIIIDLQTTKMLFVFPKIKAFVEAISPRQLGDTMLEIEQSHLKRISVGTESLDGHWCDKARLSDPRSPKVTVTAWQRPDLQYFPMKIEMASRGDVMTLVTKSFDLSKPSPTYFQVPLDFTRCTNSVDLIAFANRFFNKQDSGDERSK